MPSSRTREVSLLALQTVFLLLSCTPATGMIENLYCGMENCYEVLGITRDATKSELSKAYRQLARKYHPDMHKEVEAKKEAETRFKVVATAYEVLKDEESRNDYNYMLDNPDEFYSHYYRYYRRRMAPKVDVRIVLVVTISVISLIQYFTAWKRYESAISYLLSQPKYKLRAQEIAKEDGLLLASDDRRKSKKQKISKEAEELILRKVLEDNMDIRGGYAKPSWKDILWMRLIFLPLTIAQFVSFNLRWIWRFWIRKEDYLEEDKFYLIRRNLGMSQAQFDSLEDREKSQYLKLELWIKSKYLVWKKEREEEIRREQAESAKYKSYRRYLKNHGPSRMTFDDS